MTGRSGELPSIPEAIRARLARPTVRLSGPGGTPCVDAEEIARRAYGGWYLSAEEALNRALVAGLV
jgi:hypothetical protein